MRPLEVPAAGWAQIVAYCAYCELSQDQSAGSPAAAGDFGWKLLTSSDQAELTKKLSAEARVRSAHTHPQKLWARGEFRRPGRTPTLRTPVFGFSSPPPARLSRIAVGIRALAAQLWGPRESRYL